MAVFEVLAEVVGAVELLARVALSEFVDILEMSDPVLPVLVADANPALNLARPGKLFPAVPTNIGLAWPCCAVVEGPLIPGQCRTGPAVPPDVEGILMPLGFVLVLEPVAAERALVLLLGLVDSVGKAK